MRYFLIGFMGSGKTYWANEWGKAFELPIFDLDEEIEKAQQKSIDRIFKEEGEDTFRKIERRMLQSFFEKDNFILSCGGGTPCFYSNIDEMNKYGITIYLKSDAKYLAERLRNEKEARPLIKDITDDMLEQFIEQKLSSRTECYSKAMYHLSVPFITNENFERIKYRHAKP
jgi:shikimate kinase